MKKHRNLPFFVPFAGCPNRCFFCNQEKITGQTATVESIRCELASLDAMMASAGDLGQTENQLAFFGGSFTAIPRSRMIALLKKAQAYLEQGLITGIRISTRPDCINSEVLEVLRAYGVTHVELGIQSTDDTVLARSGRGHTAEDSYRAAALLADYGFCLAGQMMLGLPDSDAEKELATARAICEMGATEARIYPTVVFADTELYRMTLRGEYVPMDNRTAALRTVPCLEEFLSHGVKVLKIGLHASEELKNAPFGPTDGSFSELAYGFYYVEQIRHLAGCDAKDKHLTAYLPQGELSKLTGHGKMAYKELTSHLSPASLEVRTDASLPPYRVKIQIKGTSPCD